jgi:hypothetical protein
VRYINLPGTNPVLYNSVGMVINPITWTRDATLATTAQGSGSYMLDPATKTLAQVPQYADARIDKTNGVLICSTADENALSPVTSDFGKGIYHILDYQFYYFNLRENAARRTANFLNQGK